MSLPRVSILTATYGPPAYLSATLESACHQSFGDFELLVGDDSRSEETRQVVEALGDPRIRYSSNETRLGPARNHRRLLFRARGSLIAILNQDDLWSPEFLERLCRELDDGPGSVLAFTDHGVIDENGARRDAIAAELSRRYGRSALKEGIHRPFLDLVLRQAIPLAMGSVFRNRHQVLRGLPGWSAGAYDLWITGALAATGEGASFIATRLSWWRAHSESLTARGGIEGRAAGLEIWSRWALHPAFREFRGTLIRKAGEGWLRLWLKGALRADGNASRIAWRGLARLGRRFARSR